VDGNEQQAVDQEAVEEITRIIREGSPDQSGVAHEILPIVYKELRKLAAYRLAQERPGQTLQPTALVHEAYLRLVKNPADQWDSQRHFFMAAAEAMRRIVIDNARRKNRQKHGGEWHRTEMEMSEIGAPSEEAYEIHEVLDRFYEVDPESAELVKLRFFVGLTQQEAADILEISKRTADKRWAYARAWLYRAILEDR